MKYTFNKIVNRNHNDDDGALLFFLVCSYGSNFNAFGYEIG